MTLAAAWSPKLMFYLCNSRVTHPSERDLCCCFVGSPLCSFVCMRGKVAFWFLLVFFVYDLEQHSRLIEQKQRRKADRLNAVWYQLGLMRRCSWQVEGAVNHGSSHEVRADESQLSANAFEGDFFLEVPFLHSQSRLFRGSYKILQTMHRLFERYNEVKWNH